MSFRRCQRLRNLEAIGRSSIHQSLATPSSHVAMARCRASTLTDPKQALELVRSLIQAELNEKIHNTMQEYVDFYFQPAIENVRCNLGDENVSERLLEEVCASALDHAKDMFNSGGKMDKSKKLLKRKREKERKKRKTIECKANVRRQPEKWDSKRFCQDTTLFLTGSKAAKYLGLDKAAQLYAKYPDMFRYPADQEDKEFLGKNGFLNPLKMGSKVHLLVLEDILEKDKKHDDDAILTVGFKCPAFVVDKIKAFADMVQTAADPDQNNMIIHNDVGSQNNGDQVQDILNEMKHEDDLGFLHGMNLSSLVREFEMEASGSGSQHLGILSLADDQTPFPELPDHETGSGNQPTSVHNHHHHQEANIQVDRHINEALNEMDF